MSLDVTYCSRQHWGLLGVPLKGSRLRGYFPERGPYDRLRPSVHPHCTLPQEQCKCLRGSGLLRCVCLATGVTPESAGGSFTSADNEVQDLPTVRPRLRHVPMLDTCMWQLLNPLQQPRKKDTEVQGGTKARAVNTSYLCPLTSHHFLGSPTAL